MQFFSRNSGIIILLLILSGWYIYSQTHKPCSSPISYKIGTFDTRFGISKTDFLNDITKATTVWDSPVGKKLFTYDPKGDLTINLIYDERQKSTQESILLKANITKVNNLAQSIKTQYLALEEEYATGKAQYTQDIALFEQHQNSYNSSVSYWNNNGGAPKKEYDALLQDEQDLKQEQANLEEKRLQLNALILQINDFINKYNLLIDTTKSDINTINQSAGQEFEEGLYDPNTNVINIYEYSNNQKLIRVIIHELGHALNLSHNDNPKSIMYRINIGATLTLSKEDIQELKTQCNLP